MSLKIVILDGYVTNPGDVSWDPIAKHGSIEVYERTAPEQVIERAKDADVIITNKVKIRAGHIDSLPKLKVICILASGKDNVDLQAAKSRGIEVKNAVGYGSAAVAQHVFSLLFELTNRVAFHNESVQKGDWSTNRDWCYWKSTPVELFGKNFGVFGFGKIGQRVAKMAEAMGMIVFIVSEHASAEDYPFYRIVTLDEMFSKCDVVSLHSPLNEENREIINSSLFNKMKPGSFLINTARGGLINEEDLKQALINKQLAGAALDVLAMEPPPKNHPLLGLNNCIITPHMAWVAKEARERLIKMVGDNIATTNFE